MRCAVVILSCTMIASAACAESYEYVRKYTPGKEYTYSLVTKVSLNGEFKSQSTAVARHTEYGGGVPGVRVEWLSLTEEEDGTVTDLTASARQVPPYTFSLHPEGDIDLPEHGIPDMIGAVADSLTFFVSVSPAMQVEQAREIGVPVPNPETLIGDWADGTEITLGQDCTKATIELTALAEESAEYTTRYRAPDEACLEFPKAWMTAPVKAGIPNNFVQVREAGGMRVVMWGHEEFTVVTETGRATGQIQNGRMDNTLTLKLRVACDDALENCQGEFPLTLHRDVTLTLTD